MTIQEEIKGIVRARCAVLLRDLSTTSSSAPVATALSRYVMLLHAAIPLEHIILAERPYATDIHPYISSALAYDPRKQSSPTPSVQYLAEFVCKEDTLTYTTAVDWIRDGWQHISRGVILLNTCTFRKFMDPLAEREAVEMESFLRDMIYISLSLRRGKVYIHALGNPAQHSAGRIRSSVPGGTPRITVYKYKNPASVAHRTGDPGSLRSTIGTATAALRLRKLILSTPVRYRYDACEDYYTTYNASTMERLSSTGESLAVSFDEIAQYFKSPAARAVEDKSELFARGAAEMRELILAVQNAKVQAILAGSTEPRGTARSAYLNTRQAHTNKTHTRGTSSMVSSKVSGAAASPLSGTGFIDDSDEDPGPSGLTEVVESVDNIGTSASGSTPSEQVSPTTPYHTPHKQSSAVLVVPTVTPGSSSAGVFADDESDGDAVVPVDDGTVFASSGVLMTADELNDMALVVDFMETSEDYPVDRPVLEFLKEALRTQRASTGIPDQLLKVIRATHADPKQRDIADALGYGASGIVDMPSSVVQWVLTCVSRA